MEKNKQNMQKKNKNNEEKEKQKIGKNVSKFVTDRKKG